MPTAPSPRQRAMDGVPSTPSCPKAAVLKGGRPHSHPPRSRVGRTMADGHHGASSPRGPMQGDAADVSTRLLQPAALTPLISPRAEQGSRAQALNIPSTRRHLSCIQH